MSSSKTSPYKKFIPWFVITAVLAGLGGGLMALRGSQDPTVVPYSELLTKAKAGELSLLAVQGSVATAATKENKVLVADVASEGGALVRTAVEQGAEVRFVREVAPSALSSFLTLWGPTLLLVGVLVFIARKKGAGTGSAGVLSIGKSKAKLIEGGNSSVTFADVAGCDEAKHEISEIVDFLRNPSKFEALGGRIPRGVLLGGPPGTGKTLLARAIAGEAKVPFLSLSGSDFVEMFQGVGASRVRDLFRQAKQHAPCIIFIDEIDAVGRQRSGQSANGEERDQTLNQLLVEMDGFEKGQGVIVIGATNRVDILDDALLRPGRFDRQVTVGLPDVKGREQILQVHLSKVTAGPDVDIAVLAKGTPGFSGAELGNLINEATLLAARHDKTSVGMVELEAAKDKLLMGVERQSMRMSEKEKSVTAFHEAGHALVAKLLTHTDPLHKVSIIPRGSALGVTVSLPESDRYSLGRKRILDSIAMLFAGRIAEELFTEDVTTGASNDYERATAYARNMVMSWGMSRDVGPLVVNRKEAAAETLKTVDAEVKEILDLQYHRAYGLLDRNRAAMKALHDALMAEETIDAVRVDTLIRSNVSPGTFVNHQPA